MDTQTYDTCKQQPIKVTTTATATELLIKKIGEASKNEWLLNSSCYFFPLLFLLLLLRRRCFCSEFCTKKIAHSAVIALGGVFYSVDEMSTQKHTQPLHLVCERQQMRNRSQKKRPNILTCQKTKT